MSYSQVQGSPGARRAIAVAVVVLLLVAGLGGGYLWGHHSADQDAAAQTAAAAATPGGVAAGGSAVVPVSKGGPARIVGGIASGYTDDRQGAISAAVGFLQTIAMADSGLVTTVAASAQVLAGNPSAAAVKALTQDPGSIPQAGFEQEYIDNPLAVKVISATKNAVQLSFWACFTGGDSTIAGQPVLATTGCSIENVALSWERGDWKVADYQTQQPPAGTTMTTLVRTQGYHLPAGVFTLLTVEQP